MDQRRGAGLDVAPEIDVDHHSTPGLQLRHQIGAEESGLADAPRTGEKQPGAQAFIQHSRPKQAAGQLCGQLGAAKHLDHGLVRLMTEV